MEVFQALVQKNLDQRSYAVRCSVHSGRAGYTLKIICSEHLGIVSKMKQLVQPGALCLGLDA